MAALHPRILAMLGRIEEAESTLSRALQIDPASITFVVQHNAHAGAIDLAWHAGDAARPAQHAVEVVGYADRCSDPVPTRGSAVAGCQAGKP